MCLLAVPRGARRARVVAVLQPSSSDAAAAPASEPTLAAGAFGTWLEELEGALAGERTAEVPCGTCTACCTSSQFVHIGPEETAALARIPRGLLFRAPGLPAGHVLLGYDQHGRCPMFVDDRCSIYEDRPRACRTYDCRVFAATGVEPDPEQAAVAARVKRWRFDHPTGEDRARHDAVRAAAAFLEDHPKATPSGVRPPTRTQLAVAAVAAHRAFLGGAPTPSEVRVELTRRRPPR